MFNHNLVYQQALLRQGYPGIHPNYSHQARPESSRIDRSRPATDRISRRSFAICLVIILAASSASLVSVGRSLTTSTSQSLFDYVVLIVMENHNINETYNCGPLCDPYLTPFANNYSLLVNSHAVTNGSLPNYFALTMGKTNSLGIDCSPNPANVLYCPQNSTNIVDRLEAAGKSWKAYVEEYPGSGSGTLYSPGGCFIGWSAGSGNRAYAADHNPFVYYSDIVNNTSRCNHVVRAHSFANPDGPENDDVLLGDLNNVTGTAPNYMFLGPNECDQMHHLCSWPGVTDMITQGSIYLANIVPQILNSYLFKTQRAALVITFDECQNIITNNCLNTTRIYTVWSSYSAAVVRQNYKSNTFYNHYSVLHTVETAWGLQPLTSNDASASVMSEFFVPPDPSSGLGGGGRGVELDTSGLGN